MAEKTQEQWKVEQQQTISAANTVLNNPNSSAADRENALKDLRNYGGNLSPQQTEAVQSTIRTGQQQQDFKTGVEEGKRIIGEGSLGRMQTGLGRVSDDLGRVTNTVGVGESSEMQDVLKRRRDALSGMNAQELQASRSQATEQIGRGEETSRRRLQAIQAATGVRGDTAATQQSGVLFEGMKNRANFERDMLLANAQMRQQALNSYEQTVSARDEFQRSGQVANIGIQQYNLGQQLQERQLQQYNLSQQLQEKQLEQFNLQQAAKERFGQIAVGFGMSQTGSAERSALIQGAASQAAASSRTSGGK